MPDQPQQQPPQHQDRQPGTESDMTPRPRAEMENYVGSGKLTDKVAIVTGGERWGPMLQRLAQALGHAQALAGIRTVAPTGAELAADPAAARALLAQACREAASQLDVQAVILGGAGLAGMAAAVQDQVGVPVIDSVISGTRWALRSGATPAERQRPGCDVAWQGVSPELAALGLSSPDVLSIR